MTEDKNRQWRLQSRPAAALTGSEFRLSEGPIPQPSDGQVLVRNLWLSFDPTPRGWMLRDTYISMVPLGEVCAPRGSGK
jgi:NADPH-dependent curcumin reductase CurA